MGVKEYVRDLKRESLSIQTINDEFRHVAGDYILYSFWETRSSPGLGHVVDRDSACIGEAECANSAPHPLLYRLAG